MILEEEVDIGEARQGMVKAWAIPKREDRGWCGCGIHHRDEAEIHLDDELNLRDGSEQTKHG